jgi:hypothetical protein
VQRDDFFEVDNSPVTVTENGKRKRISVRKAILQKLAYSAASGDTRAALEWNKMRTRFVCEYIDEQTSLVAQIMESDKIARHGVASGKRRAAKRAESTTRLCAGTRLIVAALS